MPYTRRMKRADLNMHPISVSPPSSSPAPLCAPIKRVSTDIGPASAGAQEALRRVRHALADRLSYRGLLLLNIPPAANKAVKRLVATLSEGPTYKLHVQGPHPDVNDTAAALAAMGGNVAHRGTLYVTISDASPKTHNFELGLHHMAEALHVVRPDVKLVFAACGPVCPLKSGKTLPDLEVRDIRSIPWDFTAEANRLRCADMLEQVAYDIPAARASRLLTGLTPADARQAIVGAKILGKRRCDAGECHTGDQSIADLADAVESVYARIGKRPKGSDLDIAYIRTFLRPDLKQDSVGAAVAGLPDSVKQFIFTLKRCAALQGVVPKVKRTMLLKGPPGTGKTTVARAIAAELGYPVLAPQSSAFVNEYMGKSANNIYRFFRQARAFADMRGTPVVIFFDEIDALLKKRSGETQNGEREYDRIVNAFLESLEGIDGGTDDRLIIIGATNFAGLLDPAGCDRFSVKADMALPNIDLLQQIYRLHLQDRVHALSEEDIAAAAQQSTGLSGRHVVNILDKAGILAFEASPETAKPCIRGAHVREAARIIGSESETPDIQAFLRAPGVAHPLASVVANIPPAIGRFMRMLSHFRDLQRVVPDANKSLLVTGPPGTGKTTLVAAIANQLQLPLIAPTASALMGKYHGESAERIHRLFAQARVYARAHDTLVMIFLDDLDALVAERPEGGSEQRATASVLLENMRGHDPQHNERLIFVGTAHAAGDLDAPVRERFHLRVHLERPCAADICRIFAMHLQGRNHNVNEPQLRDLVGLTQGFSGRRVVEAINKAGYIAQEAARPGIDPLIDVAALRAGIIEEARQTQDGDKPPPEHMYI